MAPSDYELLRRLAIGDHRAVHAVITADAPTMSRLDERTAALVRLAAVVALDVGGEALSAAVDACVAAGASDATIDGLIDHLGAL